jgi:hypothetical protein
MAEVLALALSFPSVVYTVLLGVVLVYWAFVMVGVIHLGEGSEGALDGALGHGGIEGAAKGAFEGATKGALEGAMKGSLEGAAKGALEGQLSTGGDDFDLPDGDANASGLMAALIGALHLRSVPATVVLSLVVTFSWLICVVAMQVATRWFPAFTDWLVSLSVLMLAPLLSLPLTSVAVRPLAKLLATRHAPSKSDFIGRTCVVRTGSVTERFGEATLEDGGAGLVIRVRIEGSAQLSRGEQALIVDWDAERETFLVEPMKALLERR